MNGLKFFLLFLVPVYAVAGQPDRIHDIQNQVADSLLIYADREEECLDKKKELPAKELRNVGLTDSKLKDALEYFYFKNLVECSKDQADQLVVNLQMLLLVAPEKAQETLATSKLVLDDRIKLLELKKKYLKISRIQRDLIESVHGVDQPIDLIATAKSLGI